MANVNHNELAMDIYNFCCESGLWGDIAIYFDGKALASWDTWSGVAGKKVANNLYRYEGKNPVDYFEYGNPDTLSMSFEGPLNHALNAYVEGWIEIEEEFIAIFKKYGYYYEMGYSWSLSAYKL